MQLCLRLVVVRDWYLRQVLRVSWGSRSALLRRGVLGRGGRVAGAVEAGQGGGGRVAGRLPGPPQRGRLPHRVQRGVEGGPQLAVPACKSE